MSDSEDTPPPTHQRMGKPRVSFSGGSEGQDGDGESGRINNAFDTDEKSSRVNGARNSIEMDHLEISMNELNGRRVSVTTGGDAIIMRGADKSYKAGQKVLNGLDMTVPCGSIYGLLGSSGCGKTTVLSCIVGQRSLDKGTIYIFGEKPGTKSIGVPGRNIGYMPQDISLYLEFTIGETLNYFGTLTGMSKEDIKGETEFLIDLLQLPDENRKVSTLSGGQQRRVSFATALIHNPELLILDEPTAGLDPILRQNIWTHLRKLVSIKRTTVIITTHYIEECIQADNIGIMRSGRLLTERPPKQLYAEHGSTSLEEIVLRLSREDSRRKKLDSVCKSDDGKSGEEKANLFYDELTTKMATVLYEPNPGMKDSLIRIRALAGKNFVILLRNPLLLFFVLMIAPIMLLVIGTAIGPDPLYLPVGLVNEEADYLSVCSNITRIPGECNVENLSCRFLSNIPEDGMRFKIFDTEDEAISATEDGSTWGYIHFPEAFSVNLYDRMASGSNVDELTLNVSQITVRLDETSKQISNRIKKTLHDSYEDFTKIFLSDCGFDSRLGDKVLQYNKPIFGKKGTDFREFLAPGVIPSFIFFFPIITTSIRYIKEKKTGVLDRSVVGGVKTWEIMVACSISEFFVLLCQSLLNYFVLNIVFGIKILGSHFLVILAFILSGYGGLSLGFLLGSVCGEEIAAAILAMAAFFPNFVLSGTFWPIEGMHVYLQYFVQVLPCTLSGEAVRSLVSRGWEFTHPNVWPGFLVQVLYIVGYFIMTVLFHVIFKK